MDRRKLLFIIGGGLVLVLIFGIFIATVLKRPKVNEKITLQFWGTYDNATYFDDAIRNYRKDHPNIDIIYKEVPYNDYEKSLVSAFAAQTGPDIFLIHNTWLPKHIDKIAPLPAKLSDSKEPLFLFKDFQDKFVDVTVADLTRGDTIYALPLYVDTLALYYNKDTFNTAGVAQPPKTWEEFLGLIPRFTVKDDRNNILSSAAALGTSQNVNRSTDILSLLMLQSGVRMNDQYNQSATFSRSVESLNVGERAVEFYTDFSNESKPGSYTWNDRQEYSIDAFANGHVAMMLNYSHHILTLRAKSPRLNFGVAPVPQPEKSTVVVNFANYWAPTVAKQSKYSEEAWKFLVYLTTTDAAIPYLEASVRPSARRDYIEQQKTDKDLGVFAIQALSARSWYQPDNVAVETILAKLIDDVNFNRSSVRNALLEAESQVNVIFSKLKSGQ